MGWYWTKKSATIALVSLFSILLLLLIHAMLTVSII